MNAEALDHLEGQFHRHLRSVGMKWTRQKSTILRVFFRMTKPVSAEELLQPVKQEDINCGFTTVYRTLKFMVACGMASAASCSDGVVRYTHEKCHHRHLVCKDCGAVVEAEE